MSVEKQARYERRKDYRPDTTGKIVMSHPGIVITVDWDSGTAVETREAFQRAANRVAREITDGSHQP